MRVDGRRRTALVVLQQNTQGSQVQLDVQKATDLRSESCNISKSDINKYNPLMESFLNSSAASAADHFENTKQLVENLNLSPRKESECASIDTLAERLEMQQSLQNVRMELEHLVDSYQNQYAVSESSMADSASVWLLSPSVVAAADPVQSFSDAEQTGVWAQEGNQDGADGLESLESLRRALDQVFVANDRRRGSVCEWINTPASDGHCKAATKIQSNPYNSPGEAEACITGLHSETAGSGPCCGLATLRSALLGEAWADGDGCPALSGWCRAVGLSADSKDQPPPPGATFAPACDGAVPLWRQSDTCSRWMRL